MDDLISRNALMDYCSNQKSKTISNNDIARFPSAELPKGDLISRADAIEAVCRTRCGDKAKGCPAHSCLVIEEFDALPSADAEQVTSKLKKPCDSLLTDDSAECKEQKSKLESADAYTRITGLMPDRAEQE